MKLLVLRLLKVHSTKSIIESGALSLLQNCNTHYKSIRLKPIRKYSYLNRYAQKSQTAQKFQYQYELSELVEKLKTQSKSDVIFSVSDVRIEHLLDFLKTQTIESKDDVQAIVTSLILAAKLGQNIEIIVQNALGESALKKFLGHCDAFIEEMTVDDVVSALIALNLLKIPLHDPVNRKLMIRVSEILKDRNEFPLKALSNLAIYSRENDSSLFPYSFCSNGMSHILKHMSDCKSLQELHYVTVFLRNLNLFLTKDIMTEHKTKVKHFLDYIEPKANLKELFTLLSFYRGNMSFKNTRIIRNILLLMTNEISQLSNSDLQNVAWTRDWINEPASLLPEIVKAAESRPDKSTDVDLIYCRLSKQLPEHSEKVSKELLAIIANIDAKGIIDNDTLFTTLKNKRYINAKHIYQTYWEKVVVDLASINTNDVEIDATLSSLAYRYCSMQRGLTSKYRNQKFESLLRELALIEIKYGSSAWKPHRLAKLSTFIIGYATDSSDYVTLPEYFVKKIEEMAPQFTFKEIIDISTGIEYFHRYGIPKTLHRKTAAKIADRIGRLENVLNECIERILDERKHIQIDAICLLIKAYTNQKMPKRTRIIDELTKKLEETCSSDEVIITARTIQLVTGSLNRIFFVVPKLCERMLMFVNQNMDIVGADVAASLLFYLFSMGYEPYRDSDSSALIESEKQDNINVIFTPDFDFANFIRIINRDFDFIPAWSIVQACLALSFYQVLTQDLIQRVFNIDFVNRLEKELALTYDTRSYPKNILNLVMHLNRSVCLSYPEAGVPWFQQNFIEAQLAADPPRTSAYFNDIYKMLVSYVDGDMSMIRTNHVTPYGYRIPFVIYFNSNKQLVHPPFDEGPQTLNKVAILPLFNQSFRLNEAKGLRGFDRLQERHLSMLGYNVVQICYREWNSMEMHLPGAREHFMRKFLSKYNSLIE